MVDWVTSETMPEDALEQFVEARLELVVGTLKKCLQGISFELMDTRSGETEALAEETSVGGMQA